MSIYLCVNVLEVFRPTKTPLLVFIMTSVYHCYCVQTSILYDLGCQIVTMCYADMYHFAWGIIGKNRDANL